MHLLGFLFKIFFIVNNFIMKKLKIAALTGTFMSIVMTLPVRAFDLLPANIADIFDLLGEEGSGTAGFISGRVATGLFFTLGILVLFGVVSAIQAAFKYIRSQGDSGQMEEAQKAIKAIFYGIAAMMIGIVGIVLVFVFFNAGRPDPSLFQTCLSAPQSVGCTSCKDGDDPTNDDGTYNTGNDCGFCEGEYAKLADGTYTDIDQVEKARCRDPLAN